MRSTVDAEAEGDAARRRPLGEPRREQLAVAGLVAGQPQPALELAGDPRQRRLGGDAAGRVEHLERHPEAFQHLDVARRPVDLLVGAEQLQRALAALVISDAGRLAQRPQAVAAVLGDRHHARLVDRIAGRGAVAQHREHPGPHGRVEHRADHQRPVAHRQPLDRLQRHAGPRPWRGIAGRNLAGIGETRLLRRAGLPVDHRHLVAGLGQVPGAGRADDAAAEHQHLHEPASRRPSTRRWKRRPRPVSTS